MKKVPPGCELVRDWGSGELGSRRVLIGYGPGNCCRRFARPPLGVVAASGVSAPTKRTIIPEGNSQSFRKGCVVHTREPFRGADKDDDGKTID